MPPRRASLAPLTAALTAEARALRALIARRLLGPAQATPFHGWTAADVIRHLVTLDRLARLALADPAAFERDRSAFAEATGAAGPGAAPDSVFARIRDYERGLLDGLGWDALLHAWAGGLADLRQAAAAVPPDARLPWFGSSMRAGTLICARQMETWAYGQDVFDGLGAVRREGERLRNVADFAVRTYGFAFINRGRPRPAAPFVGLTSPRGASWTWGDPQAENRVEGAAVDFCLVATQRRHVLDTRLRLSGPGAGAWGPIAQCIAGAPLDPPLPGARVLRRNRP